MLPSIRSLCELGILLHSSVCIATNIDPGKFQEPRTWDLGILSLWGVFLVPLGLHELFLLCMAQGPAVCFPTVLVTLHCLRHPICWFH